MTDSQTGAAAREFRRPTVTHLMGLLGAAVVFTAGFARLPGTRDASDQLLIPLGFVAFFLVVFVLLSIQRVVIDGTTVRVLNIRTRFRWRSFDAAEVAGLRVAPAGHGQLAHGFLISLVPAAHRTWNEIALSSAHQVKYHEGIDVPFFVALTQTVTRVQPALLVQGLPMGYGGVLPGLRRSCLAEFEEGQARLRQLRTQENAAEPRKKKRRKGGR